MIHGFKRTGRSFINLIPALSQQFFVIVPDLPGHGETLSVPLSIETSGSDSIADFSDMLGAIERVVEHFNLSSLAICGHSMGGVIASQFSIVHPERVSRLVLIESTPTYSWPKSTACDDCDEVMQFENAQAYVNTRIHGAELYERLWDQYVNQDFTRVFEVEGIPILWVMNTDGKVDAEHFTRLAESVSSRAMAHTTFIGFRRKGHFLQWTIPSEINKTMVEFLVQ
jgi:pimeloyl-ACP methyl ester carboxylesterase